MPLSIGARIGSYEVLAKLGEGGMGEVYLARDTKLNRDVALKVLLPEVATDPERLARFRREARVLASLNHPHIGAIHGLEEGLAGQAGQASQAGTIALVLELVEGPTLAERMARLRASGASARQAGMPLDEALPIAKQIAEAVEAAHAHGIVHRDLKPANIKVRDDGTVKVLDFGLARAMEPAGSGAADLSWSPTVSLPAMTEAGVILGTAAYMSPEQAKGQHADERSDIWSFGVLLYEMLAGRSLFQRSSIPETLAAVMRDEPDWTLLPSAVSTRVRELVRRCLTRDARARLQSIGEARIALEREMNPSLDQAVAVTTHPPPARPRILKWILAGAAAGALAAAGILAAIWPSRSQPALLSAQLTVKVDETASIALLVGGPSTGPDFALSPDGHVVAFRGRSDADSTVRIYIRRLDQLSATPLVGTERGAAMFFSPDSQWLGFFAGPTLKKVPVTGGTPVVLAEIGGARGAVWTDDGRIVVSRGARTGLSILPAEGGPLEALTTLDTTAGEITHRFPALLPDGKTVLFTSGTNSISFDEATIMAVPLSGGSPKVILRGGYAAQYVPSGHLLYVNQSTLFAVPFDVKRLSVTGKRTPVVAGVRSAVGNGIAQYTVSRGGSLIYLPDSGSITGIPIVWLDARGTRQPIRDAGRYLNVRLSPDGIRLAMEVFDRGRSNIWILDLLRGIMSRLTGENANEQFPLWTPDGRRIVFTSNREGAVDPHLYWKRVDGVGGIERLTSEKRTEVERSGSWLPDGRTLAFSVQQTTNSDLMVVHLQGDEQAGWKPESPRPVLNTPSAEQDPAFSPDGRWLAYTSNESGATEVYVRRYPELDGKEQISSGGGVLPTWSRSGHELLYKSGSAIMAVTYAPAGAEFGASRPRVWTEAPSDGDLGRTFDLHPDGKRVIALTSPNSAGDPQLRDTVVLVFDVASVLRSRAH